MARSLRYVDVFKGLEFSEAYSTSIAVTDSWQPFDVGYCNFRCPFALSGA